MELASVVHADDRQLSEGAYKTESLGSLSVADNSCEGYTMYAYQAAAARALSCMWSLIEFTRIRSGQQTVRWGIVKIMVPFWVP